MHVVLRAAADVGSLRTHPMYLAIRAATLRYGRISATEVPGGAAVE